MTYTPPDGSREEALLRNLRAGLPMLRARFAAGFKTLRSLPDAIEATPGLAGAIEDAEADGVRVRAERTSAEARKEAGDARDGNGDRQVGGGDVVGARMEGVTGSAGDRPHPVAPQDRAAPAGDVSRRAESIARRDETGTVAPDVSGGADSHRAAMEDESLGRRGDSAEASQRRPDERILAPAVSHGAERPDPSTTPPAAVNESVRELAARLDREALRREGVFAGGVLSPEIEAACDEQDAAPRGRSATDAPAPAVSRRGAEHTDDGAPDWQGITDAAAKLAPGPFGFFLWLEARLVAAGFPPVSPWWLATLRAFYASHKRWLVVMAGRGAGKSTMLTRVAVAEALFTPRLSPPGEAWIWPFVSASTKDARNRIRQIAAILACIGLRTEKGKPIEPSYPHGHPTIEARDASGNQIEFVAYAGTIASLSGPTAIGATVDEEAKLRGDGSANPSGEVILTLAATFRARPGIRAIRCSSAWVTDGSHYGAIMDGDTIMNMVARVGDDFVLDVLDGLEAVARWEQIHGDKGRGDAEAAKRIRAHAATLTGASVNAPTWLGNPTLGNPAGPYPWLGAAVASRIEMETLDAKTFDALFPGMSRAAAWLRECASVPVPSDGADPMGQLMGLAAWNEALAATSRGEPVQRSPVGDVGPMKVRGAPPGDARYAGPPVRSSGFGGGGWGDGTVF